MDEIHRSHRTPGTRKNDIDTLAMRFVLRNPQDKTPLQIWRAMLRRFGTEASWNAVRNAQKTGKALGVTDYVAPEYTPIREIP